MATNLSDFVNSINRLLYDIAQGNYDDLVSDGRSGSYTKQRLIEKFSDLRFTLPPVEEVEQAVLEALCVTTWRFTSCIYKSKPNIPPPESRIKPPPFKRVRLKDILDGDMPVEDSKWNIEIDMWNNERRTSWCLTVEAIVMSNQLNLKMISLKQ